MEDKKIDALLNDYSAGLGHSRHAVTAPRRQSLPYWKPILAAGVGVAVVASFVLIPRRAEAASIDPVMNALKDTKFWMATTMTRANGGHWGPYTTSINQDGKIWFKSEVFGGAPRQITTLIDHEFEYDEWSELPYVLKSRFTLDPRASMSTMMDPLKNALAHVGGMRKDFTRRNGVLYHGQKAYSLSLASKLTKARSGNLKDFEVIVQSDTDLPLVSTIKFGIPGTKNFQEIRTTYGYEPRHNRQPMIPNPRKTLIDVDAEKKRWVETWTPMIEGAQLPTILSASMSPDGTIWIAYVSEGNQNSYVYPKAIDDKEYVRGVTYSLSDWKAAAAPRVKGKDVLVSTFLALNPKPSAKTAVTVSWNARPGDQTPNPATCQLTTEKWDFPSYFPPFMNSINVDLQKNSMWRSRGDAYRSKKMFKEAADAYLKSYEIMKRNHYFVNPSQNPLRAAAECYEKLGDKKTGQKLRKMIPTGARPQF